MTIKWRSLKMLTKMLLSLTQLEQEPAWDLGHSFVEVVVEVVDEVVDEYDLVLDVK